MPSKVRNLLLDLRSAGFLEISGGKGSHRKWVHPAYPGAVIISGKASDDAKPYQEKQIKAAIKWVQS